MPFPTSKVVTRNHKFLLGAPNGVNQDLRWISVVVKFQAQEVCWSLVTTQLWPRGGLSSQSQRHPFFLLVENGIPSYRGSEKISKNCRIEPWFSWSPIRVETSMWLRVETLGILGTPNSWLRDVYSPNDGDHRFWTITIHNPHQKYLHVGLSIHLTQLFLSTWTDLQRNFTITRCFHSTTPPPKKRKGEMSHYFRRIWPTSSNFYLFGGCRKSPCVLL